MLSISEQERLANPHWIPFSKRPHISIALATYNGERYLREQLDSFAVQSWRPDEVVVTDDCSTDDTVRILEDFARKAPFEVRVFRNEANLGYSGNFGRALSLCRGDIIFLSDQDDVWCSHKVETVCNVFFATDDLHLVIGDCALADDELRCSGLTQLGQLRSAGLTEAQFVNGCCSAISRRLLPLLLPIPQSELAHDNWLHRLALAMGSRRVIEDVLQLYRRHETQTSQSLVSRNSPISAWDVLKRDALGDSRASGRTRMQSLDCMLDRLQAWCDLGESDAFKAQVCQAIQTLKLERKAVAGRLEVLDRSRFLRPRSAVALWLEGGYRSFGGWKSLIKDLVCR